MPKKQRVHNEWFMTTVQVRCDCGSNKKSRTTNHQDLQVCIWGEYHISKWRTIKKVCEACFQGVIIPQLRAHAAPCGCTFALNARRGRSIPPWVKLPDDFNTCAIRNQVGDYETAIQARLR